MSEQEVVQRLLQKGYAFPCACCQRMWRADAKSADVCDVVFLPGERCGGLMAGMSFPLYEGPLTPVALATRCFRCGDPATEAFGSRQQPTRLVGVCKAHRSLLERLEPVEDTWKATG